jgi:hypothetical protein
MQTRLWITLKNTISLVDKWVHLSTNESTEKCVLSTKLFRAATIFIERSPLKTKQLQQTTVAPNEKSSNPMYLSGENKVSPKSTLSASITSLYIYNIKLKGVVENG